MRNTDISGKVSGQITTLDLNNREGCQGSSTKFVAHFGSTLEEMGVKVEDITGVSFVTRGTTEEKRHPTVNDGLLGQSYNHDG